MTEDFTPEATVADLVAAKRSTKHHPEAQLTVDVFKAGDTLIIQSAIAGVSGKDLDVAIAKDTVTIKGQRQSTRECESDHYYHRELHWGKFSRSVILPFDIDVNRAKATLKGGILTIRLPRLR